MSKRKRREVSKNTYTDQYNRKGGGGDGFLDFNKVDKEVAFFKPKERDWHKIIIIPYEIKTENHPDISRGAQIGDLKYVFDIYVHFKVGGAEKDVICLKENYGKPCPICEAVKELWDAGKEKEARELQAKRRVIYNIIDTEKDEAGLKVFSVSHYLFEKNLIEMAMGYDKRGEMIKFADIEDGKVIKFKAVEPAQKGAKWLEFTAFRFDERPKDFDADYIDELVDEAISFDELITIRDYDELHDLLYDVELSKTEEKEEPSRKKRKKRVEEEPDDEEDDDSEDEEDASEENPKKREKKTKKMKCPHDHDFGEDIDEYDECEECKVRNECDEAYGKG